MGDCGSKIISKSQAQLKMKKLIAIGCLLFVLNSTYAQVDSREFVFSIAPEISLPMGGFKKTNKVGFGGNFIAQFLIAEKLRLLASLGGALYDGKTYEIDLAYPDEYPAVGNLGIANVRQDGESKVAFSYAPQIGVELGGVDVFVKYDVVNIKTFNGSNVSALGFCVGYRF